MKSAAITKQNRQALPPGSRLWKPNNLESVATWLSPRRTSGLAVSSGLSSWRDAKGNTEFVQATAAKQPTLTENKPDFKGLVVPDFDGANDVLADETPTDLYDVGVGDFYIMAAIKTGAAVSGPVICLQREGNNEQINLGILSNRSGSFFNLTISGLAINTGSTSITTNTTYLLYCERLQYTTNVYVNGVKDTSDLINATSINNNAAACIGALTSSSFAGFDGKIAEVVIGMAKPDQATGVIGTTERQLLEGYMAHNCGIASNLPSDHPYRKGPPRL